MPKGFFFKTNLYLSDMKTKTSNEASHQNKCEILDSV
jgi:hypothetical protein